MTTAHDFAFKAIDGADLPMSSFSGHPVLLVNTASQCGLTPQYAGLEALWTRYKNQGLVVLGAPSNNFGGQEPGTESEIASFCETSFGVDFPMTSKVDVIGEAAHPLYKWVKDQLGEAGEPRWNFHKILIGKDGELAGVFGSRTPPEDPEVVAAIEAAL